MTRPRAVRRSVRLGISALAAGWLALGTIGASFTSDDANAVNTGSAATLAAPATLTVTLTVNGGGLDCRADLSWTSSTTSGITGYSIQRIRTATGEVVGGPWLVGAGVTTFVDDPVPLQNIDEEYTWRVRARLSAWRSAWVTDTDPGACL